MLPEITCFQVLIDKKQILENLAHKIEGQVHLGDLHKILYATDASIYRELPLAVIVPRCKEDVIVVVRELAKHKIPIIPRAGGTSLAGQCVGEGVVMDISKHFDKILEFNAKEKWLRLEPGVIRDDLNTFLKPSGLLFGPNTSTSNRCMIAGMVGNNSCGSGSIIYGSTRDHVLELECVLSDGSLVTFGDKCTRELEEICQKTDKEGEVYRDILGKLGQAKRQEIIRENFPRADISRRNTGYALDILLDHKPFNESGKPFNLSRLICGSEGTLAFITEIKLKLCDLPPPNSHMLVCHFKSVQASLKAVLPVMEYRPYACELMDKAILNCTKDSPVFSKLRWFVEGDPEAVLIVELKSNTPEDLETQVGRLKRQMLEENESYACVSIAADRQNEVWTLRKAGLGLLSNIAGDDHAVACIEDTAVSISDLPEYIMEFEGLMATFGQKAIYYAHAGAGELHLRPILNLKKKEDVQNLKEISLASAELVKKYKGSLSGEHGDGRVRAAFLKLMVGEENYRFFEEIKQTWDPNNIFNPGKIVFAKDITDDLRWHTDKQIVEINTAFDFSDSGGMLRLSEKCNGSADCRKSEISSGVMCPSYQATRDEKDSTRGRANVLRELMTQSKTIEFFDSPVLKDVMDLCIGCKACATECPSGVDMSLLKSEFLYQRKKLKGSSIRDWFFANGGKLNRVNMAFPSAYNWLVSNRIISGVVKRVLGIAPRRSLPLHNRQSVRHWYKKQVFQEKVEGAKRTIYLFCDAFANYYEFDFGRDAILLLRSLGYHIVLLEHKESGRAYISLGYLEEAKKLAIHNVRTFAGKISPKSPLIGLEPSALLSFRDEYSKLTRESDQIAAREIAKCSFLLDEFLAHEIRNGNITASAFNKVTIKIALHIHCHQKALSKTEDAVLALSLLQNAHIEVLDSGCCGMAGSFGYEKEHFDVSRAIYDLKLGPRLLEKGEEWIVVANGTSCRQQLADFGKHRVTNLASLLYSYVKK